MQVSIPILKADIRKHDIDVGLRIRDRNGIGGDGELVTGHVHRTSPESHLDLEESICAVVEEILGFPRIDTDDT
jgi:hypothetical protein